MKLLINVLIIAIIFIIQTHSLYFFSNPFCNSRKCLRPTFQRLTYRPITNARTDHRTFTLGKSECNVGTCVNYYYCTVKSHKPPKFCSLRNGFSGVCCKQKVSTPTVSARPNPVVVLVNQNEVDQLINELKNLEDELLRNDIVLKKNTKEFSHQNFFGGNNQVVLKEMNDAQHALSYFINYLKQENLSPADLINSQLDIRNTILANLCEPEPVCNNRNIYRTADATCNNQINPTQGKAVSTFSRLLAPDYSDGINLPRRAKDGGELPNPRLVSLRISPEAKLESSLISLLLMQFGQFIDHDLTRTAITRTHDNNKINCCDQRLLMNPNLLHPACFAIPVPNEDTFLRYQDQTCINFVRSAPAVNPKCRFGQREQLNQLSSYIDGNNIYGISQQETNDLREFNGGRLKVNYIFNKQFLPPMSNDSLANCQIPQNLQLQCFHGGDIRANEVIDLVVLHTIWLREHNRIAFNLEHINPLWSDEKIFQEARRIVIAELQHITYNEFLPLILGAKTLQHFGLKLSNDYSNSYNPTVDATILNEFSTAAYRLHSLIHGTLNFNSPDNQVMGQVQLRDVFSNPSILYQDNVLEMRVAGLAGQAMQNFDNYFSQDVTNHLFQIPGKTFGLDLVAINIQRGRDHGLQSYVNYREICGLSRVNTWDDLRPLFSFPEVVDKMRTLYRSVEDIDLFIAGTSEKPLPGATVGPTFACIIGEQFRRIKEGDRFWYENGQLDTSFKIKQLDQIKRITMAKIICDNTNIGLMQKFAFILPSQSNPKVACNTLPGINLNKWKA